MKEMECEISLCTQCKVIMRRFSSKKEFLRYKSLNLRFGGKFAYGLFLWRNGFLLIVDDLDECFLPIKVVLTFKI